MRVLYKGSCRLLDNNRYENCPWGKALPVCIQLWGNNPIEQIPLQITSLLVTYILTSSNIMKNIRESLDYSHHESS